MGGTVRGFRRAPLPPLHPHTPRATPRVPSPDAPRPPRTRRTPRRRRTAGDTGRFSVEITLINKLILNYCKTDWTLRVYCTLCSVIFRFNPCVCVVWRRVVSRLVASCRDASPSRGGDVGSSTWGRFFDTRFYDDLDCGISIWCTPNIWHLV